VGSIVNLAAEVDPEAKRLSVLNALRGVKEYGDEPYMHYNVVPVEDMELREVLELPPKDSDLAEVDTTTDMLYTDVLNKGVTITEEMDEYAAKHASRANTSCLIAASQVVDMSKARVVELATGVGYEGESHVIVHPMFSPRKWVETANTQVAENPDVRISEVLRFVPLRIKETDDEGEEQITYQLLRVGMDDYKRFMLALALADKDVSCPDAFARAAIVGLQVVQREEISVADLSKHLTYVQVVPSRLAIVILLNPIANDLAELQPHGIFC
jgi:hypothetical protein